MTGRRAAAGPWLCGLAAAALGCAAGAREGTTVGPAPPGPERVEDAAEAPAPRPASGEGDAGAASSPPSTRIRHREGEAAGLYYLETVVGAVPVDAPLPLVVALHGLGDRPHPLEDPFFGTPDPVRVVQPRAPTPLGEGYTWLPHRVSAGRTRALARAAAATAARLVDFVDAVREARPTVGRPVVTGFSQGGILAFVLAVRHPAVFGASLPLSGWLPPPLWPRDAPEGPLPPIRSMHGLADRVVPAGPTRRAVDHLARLGFPVELVEVPGVGHTRSPEMDVALARWLAAAVRREWRRGTLAELAAPTPGSTPGGHREKRRPGGFGTRVGP